MITYDLFIEITSCKPSGLGLLVLCSASHVMFCKRKGNNAHTVVQQQCSTLHSMLFRFFQSGSPVIAGSYG